MDGQKILVLSDTHGNISALEAVLKFVQNNYTINAIAFLGDGIQDIYRAPSARIFSCEWKMVRGNNDYEHTVPEAAVFNFGGRCFFLCHGHRYGLYNGYQTLIAAARKMNADTVLFGHIHIPIFETISGITLINPGSIARPRSSQGETFAIIECVPGKPLNIEFLGINKGEIRKTHIQPPTNRKKIC